MDENWLAMVCMVVLSCWMPVTVLICAICEVIWALSTGFIGSWWVIWATSSFRKRSCWSAALVVLMPFALVLPGATDGGVRALVGVAAELVEYELALVGLKGVVMVKVLVACV